MKLRPMKDKIIVSPQAAPEKVGSIILPDKSRHRPERGEALAVGDDVCSVVAGEIVLFAPYAGTDVELDGQRIKVLTEDDILGVIES